MKTHRLLKPKVSFAILTLGLTFLPWINPAWSMSSCRSALQTVTKKVLRTEVHNLESEFRLGKLTKTEATQALLFAETLGMSQKDYAGPQDFLQDLVYHFESQHTEALDAANGLAEVSHKFLSVFSKRPIAERRNIQFLLGQAIIEMEQFTKSEYLNDDSLAMINKPMIYAHIAARKGQTPSFSDMTRSFIDNTELYDHLPSSGQGILKFTDIRDIESHNYFPVEYKGHDVKHILYATKYPRGAAMVFSAARSKNHLRYILIAGLFEGVDSIQFSWERKLTGYFKAKGLSLEDALLFLARAPQSELQKLLSSLQINATDIPLQTFATWRPKYHAKYPLEGLSGAGFKAEVANMIREQQKFAADPANEKYLNAQKEIISR
jgi:hypothetical protein